MRVAHVITRLIVGGAQENTVASVLGLRRRPELQVSLISGPTEGPEGSLEGQVRGKAGVLSILPELVRPLHPFKDWLALRKLSALFRVAKPDVVHTHSGKAGVLGRRAAAEAQVPVIVHTVHGPSFGEFQGWLPNLVYRAAERSAGRHTSHFVCVAEAMRDQYLRAGIGVPEAYTVIRSGFELSPFLRASNSLELRGKLGLAREHIVVGKIARLFKLKGHEDLLEAAPGLVSKNPALRFLLVGDGEWRGRFEAKAKDLGVDRHFVFAGLVPPEQVAEYVGVMDMLVHLSLREGLARALPQAMAAGKAVVAYDCDGAREVCRNGETGYLIGAGDLAGLQAAILRLAASPELRCTLGSAGRELARREFQVEDMVERLHQLYHRLLLRSSAAAKWGTP